MFKYEKIKEKKEKKEIFQKFINYFDNWTGDNFIFFNRTVITGPLSFKSMIVTLTLFVIPSILFCSLSLKVIKFYLDYLCIVF